MTPAARRMSAANPFAVAVEALRDREVQLDEYVSRGMPEMSGGRRRGRIAWRRLAGLLAEARAALALFERLASVEVEVRTQGGIVEPRVFVEARSGPRFYGVSLLHVWQDEDHSQAEVEAVAHIIATLECRRRRNEAQP